MLSVALRTLRARWVVFVGSFVALALGVALIAVMGLSLASSLNAPDGKPERFAAAPVVVKGADTLRVPTSIGVRVHRLAQPRAVPAGAVAQLKKLGTVVEDRSFAVRARGGPGDLVGHPWSTAAFAPYEIDAGRAPRAADEGGRQRRLGEAGGARTDRSRHGTGGRHRTGGRYRTGWRHRADRRHRSGRRHRTSRRRSRPTRLRERRLLRRRARRRTVAPQCPARRGRRRGGRA